MKRWIAPLVLLLALGGTAAAYTADRTGESITPCCPECDDCDHCPFR